MNSGSQVNKEINVPEITESIHLDSAYKSVTDRYFSRRYCIDANNIISNDHLLLFHSNRICLVTLAPSHPLFSEDDDFSVDFQIGNMDRSKNCVKGKGKKGGQLLNKNSRLCKILFKNGKVYDILSCIDGKLIEVNDALLQNPSLLKTFPDSDGYVAIILSNISASESRKNELLTHENYLIDISQRGANTDI